jgi:ABC-type lipoprotein release transport system permease subunit
VGEAAIVESAVKSLFERLGLEQACDVQRPGSFCVRLPQKNNFQTALREQSRVGTGGAFFAALLLALVAVGTAGLQMQTVLTRWHDYGVLQVIGFSPSQILLYHGLQLLSVPAGGITFAAIGSLMLQSVIGSFLTSFAWAAGVSLVVTGLAALPILLWPLSRSPAVLIRESA